MSYHDALVAKWATLSGTTEEKLEAINAATVPGPTVPVSVLQIMTYLRTLALWLPIKAAQATCVGAAAAVDYNSDSRVQTLDVSLPIAQAMLADLKAHALLTDEHIAAITAMGKTTLPWWQASVAEGGGGLSGQVSLNDLTANGLS